MRLACGFCCLQHRRVHLRVLDARGRLTNQLQNFGFFPLLDFDEVSLCSQDAIHDVLHAVDCTLLTQQQRATLNQYSFNGLGVLVLYSFVLNKEPVLNYYF